MSVKLYISMDFFCNFTVITDIWERWIYFFLFFIYIQKILKTIFIPKKNVNPYCEHTWAKMDYMYALDQL